MKNQFNTNYSKILTKKFLIKEYIVNNRTIYDIAKEIKCDASTIRNYLIKYEIKRRTTGESMKGRYAGKNSSNYKHGDYLKQYYCIDCKIEISVNSGLRGNGRCSPCAKKGENGGGFIDGRTLKPYYCIDCGKEIKYRTVREGNSRCCSCANIEKFRTGLFNHKGKNHPNYIEGLIREYPNKFNKQLKEAIRQRDNHQCQICGALENGIKLDVHHIDYNKENLNPENLISLCKSCHMQTNANREVYIEYFGILSKEIIK